MSYTHITLPGTSSPGDRRRLATQVEAAHRQTIDSRVGVLIDHCRLAADILEKRASTGPTPVDDEALQTIKNSLNKDFNGKSGKTSKAGSCLHRDNWARARAIAAFCADEATCLRVRAVCLDPSALAEMFHPDISRSRLENRIKDGPPDGAAQWKTFGPGGLHEANKLDVRFQTVLCVVAPSHAPLHVIRSTAPVCFRDSLPVR